MLGPGLRVLLTFGAIGGIVRLAAPPPPPDDAEGLAASLGRAAGVASVKPEDVRWEPSEGMVTDALRGRFALYLAAAEPGAPRDVWRARVRLSPDGRPLEILDAHDLTSTPLGDDHALILRDRYAAFATTAYGQEQSVTLLDLSGEGERNRSTTAIDRAMSAITNVQQTGSSTGIGRVDVTLDRPARALGLALEQESLRIDLPGAAASVQHASLDATSGELDPQASGLGLHALPSLHLPKRLSHWAVDTARAVSWIGPEPIAWLEGAAFGVADSVKKLAYKVKGGEAGDVLATVAEPPPPLLDTSEASLDAGHWPPPRITPIWKTPEEGEGEWVQASPPWLRRVPRTDASAPPAFLRTFVRPDEERPYAKVILVAMDTRQLDLEMEGGVEDPQPLTGPHGAGRLPRDPGTYRRVVAAFNGAFKTEHGHYGMMVHRRILLPPVPGAASVVVLKDGRVGLGTWGAAKQLGAPPAPPAITGIADFDISSFRQNLDALVDRGQVNPSGRSLWGYTLPGKGVQTERSALCVTNAGHLFYGWGDDVSATTLGKAMRMAGCDYGMHLDMNPYHTGFMFTNIEDIEKHRYKTELLSSGMEIAPDRYVQYAPKDFFYVLVHDPSPPGVDGGGAWSPDAGAQPAPEWMAGIWSTKLDTRDGVVELVDVESGRARWRVCAGAKEAPGTQALRELPDEDKKRVLFAVGLGVAPERHPRGIATDGRLAVPVRGAEGWAVLVPGAAGGLTIERAAGQASDSGTSGDLVELPLILDAEGGSAPKTESGTAARVALGTTSDGRVILARGEAAGEKALADALSRAGCTRAVALDRGESARGLFDRAGLASPPRARYEESVLYAIATPMKPRAFRFDAQAPAPAPQAKK
jgi:hypothetical protein